MTTPVFYTFKFFFENKQDSYRDTSHLNKINNKIKIFAWLKNAIFRKKMICICLFFVEEDIVKILDEICP